MDALPKPTSSDLAYAAVKELIVTGELPGGELISEGDIASRHGTSRTPVREAFLRLQAEGWMRLFPKRGALVVPIADGEAEHIVSARRLVETGSLREFAGDPQACVNAAREMRAGVDRQRELPADDHIAFAAEDADFHSVVVRHGGNPLLATFYSGLRDRQRRMTASSMGRDPGQRDSIIADHAQLADIVERGAVADYDDAVDEHMRRVHGLKGRPS